MNFLKKIFFFGLLFFASSCVFANSQSVETIVMIRHGEKPVGGYGQLSCQGLNRALLLPHFFKKNFPPANYIFAPNPGDRVAETDYNGALYSYVRPLMTIDPTAIALVLPVNTEIGYKQVHKLSSKLLEKKYHHATVYVAWEHHNILKTAHILLKKFNNSTKLPHWSDSDYSRVFVFVIDWNKKPATLKFYITNEKLYHISKVCPF